MEKISTTPMPVGNNNNNKLSGISSNTNTKESNVLNLEFGMPKLSESSTTVRAVSLRANFKKSNTCGSLFAKCKCDSTHPHLHHTSIIPLVSETNCDQLERLKIERNRRKTQSFSHPDTPIIFTEENRYPATTTADLLNRLRSTHTHESIVRSGNQKIEIKHSKRSSSPNLIGEYSSHNIVDIHPEFKVQIALKSPNKNKSEILPQTTTVRPILKKSSRSFPFTTSAASGQQHSSSVRSFDSFGERSLSSSSYSVDETSEEIELSGKVSDSLVINDLDANAKSTPTSPTRVTNTTTVAAEIHNIASGEVGDEEEEDIVADGENPECKTNGVKVPPLSPSISKDFSDEKFLQVSITHVPFALPHSLTHNE